MLLSVAGPAKLVAGGGIEVPQLGRVRGVRVMAAPATELSFRFHGIRPASCGVRVPRGSPGKDVSPRCLLSVAGCTEIPGLFLQPKLMVACVRVVANRTHPGSGRAVLILAGEKIIFLVDVAEIAEIAHWNRSGIFFRCSAGIMACQTVP